MSSAHTPAAVTASIVRLRGADDNELVGDVWGEAPYRVVLLHGGGQTRGAWGSTGARFAELGLSTLAYDLRGHGESAWDEQARYTFPDHGRDLAVVLEDASESVILVGASLGGSTALNAALRHPGKIRAVVLVDITPTMQLTGVGRIVGFMRANPEGFENLDEARQAIAAYLPHRKREALDGSLKRNLRQSAESGKWHWHWDPRILDVANPEWYRKQTENMELGIRALDVPVILVRGGESDVIIESDVERFLSLGPHTHRVDVPGAHHMVAGDENELFLSTILAALSATLPDFSSPIEAEETKA